MDEEQCYFEGCGREGPIRCIFLCEFHPVAGPRITCQVNKIFQLVVSYIKYYFTKGKPRGEGLCLCII
jgi:hypothetical protein